MSWLTNHIGLEIILFCFIQGLLKLEHCFTKPKNEEAEVIEVQAGDKKLKIVMAPGNSVVYTYSAQNLFFFPGYKNFFISPPPP